MTVRPAAASQRLPLPAILLPAVLLLGLALRLFHLDHWSLWADEVASLLYARQPLGHIWGADTMPPLYYSLLHVWRLGGESEWWLRLSSALISTASLPLAYAVGRRLGGERIGLWSAFFLATSPFSLFYAQELRMYALLEFGALLALFGLAGLLRDPARALHPAWSGEGARRDWLLYGLGALTVLYTHNTGFLLPASASLLVLLYARGSARPWALLRNWLLVNGLVLLLWAIYWPWLYDQLVRVGSDFWVRQPDLAGFLGRLAEIHLGLLEHRGELARLAWPVIALALAGGAVLACRRWPAWTLGLMALALLPPAIELFIGIWRPILLPRTLIWTGVPSVLALAVAADWLWRRQGRGRLRAPMLAALAALLLARSLSVADYYLSEAKPDWRGMVALIERTVPAGEPVVFAPSWQRSALIYAFQRSEGGGAERLRRLIAYKTEKAAEVRGRLSVALPSDSVWVVLGNRHYLPEGLPVLLRELLPCAERAGRIEFSRMALLRYDVAACAGAWAR